MIYGYEQPIQLPTLDLYDKQIMAMALNAAKDMYDRNEQNLKEFYKTYGDFMSPIAADQEWWDQNMEGATRRKINEIYARGGDPLRNRADMAELQQFVNSRPYTQAAFKKLRAENAREYYRNMAILVRDNKYSKDFSEYLKEDPNLWAPDSAGVTSPTAFSTMDDIIEPIVKNLKPSFDEKLTAAKNDGYDYSTVSRDRIIDTIDDKMHDIISSPIGGYYYKKAYDAAGGDEEMARSILREWFADRASDHVQTNREANPYALDKAKTQNDIDAYKSKSAVDLDAYGKKAAIDWRYKQKELSMKGNGGNGSKDKEQPNIFREAEAYTPGTFNKAHNHTGTNAGLHVGYTPSNQYNQLIDPMITANSIQLKDKDSGEVREAYRFDARSIQDNVYTIDQNGKVKASKIVNDSGSNKYTFVPNGQMRAAKYGNGGYKYYISGEMSGDGGTAHTEDGSTEVWIEVKERAWNHGTKKV